MIAAVVIPRTALLADEKKELQEHTYLQNLIANMHNVTNLSVVSDIYLDDKLGYAIKHKFQQT